MPTREERAALASKNIGRMKAVFPNEIKESIAGVRIYNEGDGWNLAIEAGEGDTAVAIQRGNLAHAVSGAEGKVCVLDPASFTKPASSYEKGGWGPEAMLCAAGTLYPVLTQLQKSYYDKNKRYFSDGLCSDRAAFVPGVVFLRNGAVSTADVIVMAEPNRTRALQGPRSEAECDVQLKHRIQSALGIAADNGCTTFVASAFGCGFNGNDPVQVAGVFKDWITEHPGVIRQLIFVLGSQDVVDAFGSVFPGAAPEPKPVRQVEAVEEEADDDDEMDGVPEPNADGRWVF